MKNTFNDSWLWSRLSPEQKKEACLQGLSSSDTAPNLVMMLAAVLKFRPNALMKKKREELAGMLASHMMAKPLRDGMEPVLRNWLVQTRGALIADFLEAAGLPHEGAFIKDEARAPEAVQVEDGIEGVLKAYPAADLDLYLGYVLVFGDDNFWKSLHEMASTGHAKLAGLTGA